MIFVYKTLDPKLELHSFYFFREIILFMKLQLSTKDAMVTRARCKNINIQTSREVAFFNIFFVFIENPRPQDRCRTCETKFDIFQGNTFKFWIHNQITKENQSRYA